MRLLSTKTRLLGSITAILAAGFLATSLAGYMVSRRVIEQGIAEQSLPLTGDNVYSEIQKDVLRPVFISSLMAHDTFVRDWILNGEKDQAQLVRYLAEVKAKYGTVSSFLVSNLSSKYYYAGGTLKSVQPDEPRDAWFYRVRDLRADYETNVDADMANRDSMTIFINHRVLDYKGNFIGATGVGLTLDTMSRVIDRYQARFKRDIYFLDTKGAIVLTGKAMQSATGSIRQNPAMAPIADAILNHSATQTRLSYRKDKGEVLVNSRFIPELNWYLVVEQNVSDDVRPILQVFALNLAISFGVTLLVLAITLLMVNRYQRRLEKLASTDALTGLLNRQALDLLFRQSLLDSQRSNRPLSAILFDIDHFKQVNDTLGHLAGDKLIKAVAQEARASVRASDIVTRWGGDEYLILLSDCPLEQACVLAEQLRQRIEQNVSAQGAQGQVIKTTVSIGVAQYCQGETDSAFFARADSALYQAKSGGRNRCASATDKQLAA